jgi:hypothetical protein
VFWLHFSIAQVSQDGEGNSHRFLLVMIRTLFHCTQHAILLWWLLRVLVQKAPFELGVSLVAGKAPAQRSGEPHVSIWDLSVASLAAVTRPRPSLQLQKALHIPDVDAHKMVLRGSTRTPRGRQQRETCLRTLQLL